MGGTVFTPPLDAVSSKLLAAYGLSRLITGVTEAARVRDFAVAELDVGTLADGEFDVDTFANHVAAEGGQGFAAKLYDHVAAVNAVHTDAAKQPEILASGQIGTSKANLLFTGNEFMTTASLLTWTNVWTDGFELWVVVRPTDLTGRRAIGARGSYAPAFFTRTNTVSKPSVYSAAFYDFDTTLIVNTNYLLRFYYHSGVWRCDVNGVTEATTHTVAAPNNSGATWCIGSEDSASARFAGYMGPVILFKSALTAPEASALATTLKTFYGIA